MLYYTENYSLHSKKARSDEQKKDWYASWVYRSYREAIKPNVMCEPSFAADGATVDQRGHPQGTRKRHRRAQAGRRGRVPQRGGQTTPPNAPIDRLDHQVNTMRKPSQAENSMCCSASSISVYTYISKQARYIC